MSRIEMQTLSKSFGTHRAVKEFSLDIGDGEFVSLLGGSGCGKTTTLRMLAGLEFPDSGRILVDGIDLTWTAADKRRIGMVFQNYALFPNMDVRSNIAFGLKVQGLPRREREGRTEEMLDLVGLSGFDERYPHQLSGGQQQRVALARALAPKPRILLLDEPLSALDAQIRGRLGLELRAIQKRLGITAVYVTHDQAEALSLSDRVAVMNAGILEQVGTPSDVYARPATAFSASFIGTLNLLPARVESPASGLLSVAGMPVRSLPLRDHAQGSSVSLGLRPESLNLEGRPGVDNCLRSRVRSVSFLGSTLRLSAEAAGALVHVDLPNRPGLPLPREGDDLPLWFSAESCLVLDREGRAAELPLPSLN